MLYLLHISTAFNTTITLSLTSFSRLLVFLVVLYSGFSPILPISANLFALVPELPLKCHNLISPIITFIALHCMHYIILHYFHCSELHCNIFISLNYNITLEHVNIRLVFNYSITLEYVNIGLLCNYNITLKHVKIWLLLFNAH